MQEQIVERHDVFGKQAHDNVLAERIAAKQTAPVPPKRADSGVSFVPVQRSFHASPIDAGFALVLIARSRAASATVANSCDVLARRGTLSTAAVTMPDRGGSVCEGMIAYPPRAGS